MLELLVYLQLGYNSIYEIMDVRVEFTINIIYFIICNSVVHSLHIRKICNKLMYIHKWIPFLESWLLNICQHSPAPIIPRNCSLSVTPFFLNPEVTSQTLARPLFSIYFDHFPLFKFFLAQLLKNGSPGLPPTVLAAPSQTHPIKAYRASVTEDMLLGCFLHLPLKCWWLLLLG